MVKKSLPLPADYIMPLNINGLEGRLLHLPAPPTLKRHILFVYGQHASLERWWGLLLNLNKYGAVTAPDLPGFGGMDSFYTIGKTATLDNFADYLAAFIKLRHQRQRLTIIGLGFGFAVTTRMLQSYPSLADKVDCLVSLDGFSHRNDFTLSGWQRLGHNLLSSLCSRRWPAVAYRYVALGPLINWMAGAHHPQLARLPLTPEEVAVQREYESRLWRLNDVRTHMCTTRECLQLDNCAQAVDLPVAHLAANVHVDNHAVEQHLRIIFTDFRLLGVAPPLDDIRGALVDAKAATPWMPPKLRRVLRQQ